MDMTEEQLTLLGNDIRNNSDPVVVDALATGNNNVIRDWYNQDAAPSYWVWKPSQTVGQVGETIDLDGFGRITAANSERVQSASIVSPDGFTPSRIDHRAFFGNVFSAAAGAQSRQNILRDWQRVATYAEQVLATGEGTQGTGDLNSDGTPNSGSPAVMSYAGEITTEHVAQAIALTA